MFTGLVPSSIARDCFPITPSTNPLPERAEGVYVSGTAGNIVGITHKGRTVTIPVTAGQTFPCLFTHILPATTATGLFALVL